ncbi:MAG: flotillin family protein [Deltaproteobacteria bacterium]|nr:flotillin family protein [Deltaproteobacteria bacterium]
MFPTDSGSEGVASAVLLLGGALAVVLGLAVLALILQKFLYICAPNEVLIFSGRKHKLPDGSVVGFKIVHGGRAYRIPLIENVSRLDMRIFPVQVTVNNAFSKGGIALAIQAIANVKISSDEVLIGNAAERFLGMAMHQIAEVAQQTLEASLREVLSQLTPEEVNEDRLKFADHLVKASADDFDKLGLHLDVLKVQHVSDEQQYLINLGRARIAGMLRDAENAENAANQVIAEAQAANRQRAETVQKGAEGQVLQKKNLFAAELAKMEAEAKSVENEAAVAAETARSTAEQELQGLRAEYEKLRLECDVVLPAQAKRKGEELAAQGDASPLVETGKARAAALQALAQEWNAAGPEGREVYVLQQLTKIAEAAVVRAATTQIQELNIVDGGDASSYMAFAAGFPAVVSKVMAETGKAVGVDIPALFHAKKAGA